jgi:hypothetical protein
MFKVTRRYVRNSENTPPCEGHYKYELVNQTDLSRDYLNSTAEYEEFKSLYFVEDWHDN